MKRCDTCLAPIVSEREFSDPPDPQAGGYHDSGILYTCEKGHTASECLSDAECVPIGQIKGKLGGEVCDVYRLTGQPRVSRLVVSGPNGLTKFDSLNDLLSRLSTDYLFIGEVGRAS